MMDRIARRVLQESASHKAPNAKLSGSRLNKRRMKTARRDGKTEAMLAALLSIPEQVRCDVRCDLIEIRSTTS